MGFRQLISSLSSTSKSEKRHPSPANSSHPKNTKNNAIRGTYRYEPFTSASTQIRLLQLLPGSGKSKIIIDLGIVPFGERDNPRFSALSYTWGPPGNESMIHVSRTQQTIAVRPSLLEALYSLRDPKLTRLLWIDAICIDQFNQEEKSEQINLMGNLYAKATRVICWIGLESATTRLAMRTLEDIDDCTLAIWSEPSVLRKPKTHQKHLFTGREYTDLNEKEVAAIMELLARRYFSRLWVYQEVHLGAERASLHCGPYSIRWEAVRKIVLLLKARRGDHPNMLKGLPYSQWRFIQYLCDSESSRRDFLESLHRTRRAACTDDRDRVFSVLSLFSRGHNFGMSKTSLHGIDKGYLKSTPEVYIEVACMYARTNLSMEFLNYLGQQRHPTLPSWVPDWSMNDPSMVFEGVFAAPKSYGFPVQVCLKPYPQLRAPGLIVDQITYSSRNMIVPPEVRKKILSGSGSSNFCLDALTRSLRGNDFMETATDSKGEFIKSRMSYEMDKAEILKKLKSVPRLAKFTDYVRGRALVTTARSKIGLAPGFTEPEDIIALFPTSSSAVVLRPRVNGHFAVIGPAYIDGYMQGEAFLGPLPPHIQQIKVYEEAENVQIENLNHSAGQWEPEDPRLGPLPRDWRRTSEGGFANKRT